MSNTYFSEHIDDHLMYALPTVDPEVTFFAPAGRDLQGGNTSPIIIN